MAKKTKSELRGDVKTVEIITKDCMDCKVKYEARKTTYDNGDIVISPKRCEDCQTAHVVNNRIGQFDAVMKNIGNCKTRTTAEQRNAILEHMQSKFEYMLNQWSGVEVKQTGFDLKSI